MSCANRSTPGYGTRSRTEFGDFQTPPALAAAATQTLVKLGIRPRSIVEPTCGMGAFVEAAAPVFSDAEIIIGADINRAHLDIARERLCNDRRVELRQADFFSAPWNAILERGRAPWLIIGNPPWVTSAQLGVMESGNLPEKTNFHGRRGIDAMTGKSNFDISEWMLLQYLHWLQKLGGGAFAVLCKTTVARKILLHAWKRSVPIQSARIFKIDALANFGAAVDACFFVVDVVSGASSSSCDVFESLDATGPSRTIAHFDGYLVTDAAVYRRRRDLLGEEKRYRWRSGIKHDCSKVMELLPKAQNYLNGLGEEVSVEPEFLYPMLKSSDVGNGRTHCRAMLLVTQRSVGEDTAHMEYKAPRTWAYLQERRRYFENRGSSIYRNKPSFSIFGVGPYSFAPWKIAISGFYKKLNFLRVGPVDGRPVVFDDTVYFLPCRSEDEALFLEQMFMSGPAREFLNSMISWDEKRPITVDLLKRLDIGKLASVLGRKADYAHFAEEADGPFFVPGRAAA
jgi:hypothetical protein